MLKVSLTYSLEKFYPSNSMSKSGGEGCVIVFVVVVVVILLFFFFFSFLKFFCSL